MIFHKIFYKCKKMEKREKGIEKMNAYDYQKDTYDTIAAYSQGVGYAEVLGIAANKDIFTAIGMGKAEDEISALWDFDEETSTKLVEVLVKMGFLGKNGGFVFNTPVAAKYLDRKSPFCDIESFINAIPSPVFLSERLLPFFEAVSWQGGAKITAKAPFSSEFLSQTKGITFGEEKDCALILAGADYEAVIDDLGDDGFLVIGGEFSELETLESAINGLRRHLGGKEVPMPKTEDVFAVLEKKAMVFTPLLPLSRESGCIIGAKNEEALAKLTFAQEERLIALLKREEIQSIKLIETKDVVPADWVADHCRWGCSSYGDKCCPPNSPTYKETETSLKTYTKALLIEGQPPTGDFQKVMLKAEKTAFKAGYYKAFAYWAGPCDLCTECKLPKPPKKCTATRPSMESAGIDVFATVRKQGYTLETRKEQTEFVKYFGLLLLY